MVNNRVPVFVKVENYKDISKLMEKVRQKLGEAKELMKKIGALKRQEEDEINTWAREIADVEDRIDAVDRALTQK